jgi:antitoxin component of MazEF toxin-antitoxin module
MPIERHITKIGGSLGLIIPRDIAEAMGVEDGTPVQLQLVGRKIVILPPHDAADERRFQQDLATVKIAKRRQRAGKR